MGRNARLFLECALEFWLGSNLVGELLRNKSG
jgi:hypothetical protein